METEPHNIFRDGKVHVCEEMCKTCIFRPGNLMKLEPGRVKGMVDDAKQDESAIVCHSTLERDNAACKGFFDKHPTQPLQVAERLDLIEFVDPHEGDEHDE